MKILRLFIFIIIAFLPSVSGVVVKTGEWYTTLIKPVLNPPGWVFGPVWTVLYLLIGISGWLAWEKRQLGTGSRSAFVFYSVQLAFNVLWTIFFFGLHQPLLALCDLLAMWVFVLLNIIYFWRIRPASGILLIPYIMWISFAGYLNFALWWLNRT